MRIIIAGLVLALVSLQYKLWLGDGSIIHLAHLEKKLHAQEVENQRLNERNRVVEADILELKSGEQALEEQARFELGMVKEGEVYYHFSE